MTSERSHWQHSLKQELHFVRVGIPWLEIWEGCQEGLLRDKNLGVVGERRFGEFKPCMPLTFTRSITQLISWGVIHALVLG